MTMMRRWRAKVRVGVAVAAAVAMTLLPGAGAVADPGDVSHVDVVTAAVDADGIAVTGRATFVDVPGVVGEDATGDVVGDGGGSGVPAADLGTATISRPDPFAGTLRFTATVANQPPTGGVPEFVSYRWDFTNTFGGKVHDVTLRAWRSNLWRTTFESPEGTNIDPFFTIKMCGEDPEGVIKPRLCANRYISGSMGDNSVAWDVPIGFELLGGRSGPIGLVGSVITSEDGIKVMSNVSPVTFVPFSLLPEEGVVLDEMATDAAYTVPGPSVRIGIAPVGAALEDVPLTASGAVDSQGAFSGRLPMPAMPGEYTVVVRACHGSDSCGIAATAVTV